VPRGSDELFPTDGLFPINSIQSPPPAGAGATQPQSDRFNVMGEMPNGEIKVLHTFGPQEINYDRAMAVVYAHPECVSIWMNRTMPDGTEYPDQGQLEQGGKKRDEKASIQDCNGNGYGDR
jgi:hypothetical protein